MIKYKSLLITSYLINGICYNKAEYDEVADMEFDIDFDFAKQLQIYDIVPLDICKPNNKKGIHKQYCVIVYRREWLSKKHIIIWGKLAHNDNMYEAFESVTKETKSFAL